METDTDVPSPDPLPDEVALLRDALVFIGDLGGDANDLQTLYANNNASNGGLSSPLTELQLEQSDVVQAAPVSALENDAPLLAVGETSKPKGNLSRNKRRDELLYLRDMVGDLESKLSQMKREGDEQRLLKKLNAAPSEEARSSVIVCAAWEQVATRQAEERERAEMENIRLKRLLEDQIQVGKSLERLLRKRPKLEAAVQKSRGQPEKQMRLASLPTSWDDTYIFQELEASCESQYLETPRVLAKVLQLMEGQLIDHKVELVHDDDLGMVMRASESRTLPFHLELATQEFWEATPDLARTRGTGNREVEKSDTLITAKLRAHANFGHVDGDFSVFIAERRYCEPHRTVITSSAFLDPTEVSDMKMDGIYMRFKSWIVFEPIVSDVNRPHAPTKAATRMMTYSVAVPQIFDRLEDQSRKVGTLTNFLMSAISVELESRQQDFENRLFNRSCK